MRITGPAAPTAGCKLESTLLQRAGRPGGVQRRLALLRWHGRIPLAEGAKYWANLLQVWCCGGTGCRLLAARLLAG